MPHSLIDLFAGCGGLGLGFDRAGFEIEIANELHPDPATTYCRNLLEDEEHKMLLGPIEEQLSTSAIEMRRLDKMDIDCIAGGPPCQGLSLAGMGNPDDPRNQLFREYIRVVKQIQPRSVLFENVPGFVNRYSLGLRRHLESELSKMGYLYDSDVVQCSDYGVPQKRERFFLLGVKRDCLGTDEVSLPPATHTKAMRRRELTPAKVIGDLDSYVEWGGYGTGEIHGPSQYTLPARSKFAREMRATSGTTKKGSTWNTRIPNHGKRVARRMAEVQKGKEGPDFDGTDLETKKISQRLLHRDKPAPITILSIPDDFVHYNTELPRTLSVRECARFQTFPDDFRFHGKRTTGGERRKIDVPQYTQVANAIPPRIAKIFAEHLSTLLD